MYGARQARFRQQVHQREEDVEETESIATTEIDPDEEAVNTPMYKKILFKESKDLQPLLKKAQYRRFPEAVRKQMRSILNDNFKLTLNHIAGAEAGNSNYEIEAALTHIAKNVDKSLKTHTIPGNFDTNLLNPILPDAIIEAKEKFNIQSKQVAKEVILLERKLLVLEQEREFADKETIINEKKAILENLSMRQETEPDSFDYIQSLLQFPSSSIFESNN